MSDFARMFGAPHCDFEMRMSDGKILKAHKAVLIARSPVFRNMLTTAQGAQQNSLDIPYCDSTTMNELLRFVYCNRVNYLDDLVFGLIYAAEKYQIAQLKDICGEHIISKLTQENVVDALIVADRVSDMERLFNSSVAYVAS